MSDRSVAQVQRPVLQGHQPVAALWFPADWFDEDERMRRIVRGWRAGSSVVRFAQGDLLRYPNAVAQCCELLPGWPLRREGAVLSTAPLSEAERLRLPHADVWLVLDASVLALSWTDGMPLDMSRFIALGPALLETYDCRATLAPPSLVAPEARPLREVLGDAVPLPSEQREAFLEAMKRRQSLPGPAESSLSMNSASMWAFSRYWRTGLSAIAIVLFLVWLLAPPSGGKDGNGWQFVAFVLLGLALGCIFARAVMRAPTQWTIAPGAQGPDRAPATQSAGTGISPRRPLGRLVPQRWREWLTRLTITSQVARLLGRQQAAFLRRMLERFEQGDLEGALRHAIPLGREGESLGQAFGTPQPRTDLTLSRTSGPAAAIFLGASLEQHLRQIYRRSFERLDHEGRVDEAVFVLAELLRVRQEALDYLEKKGRLSQAAELALTWDQPPEVIVRLLCLAGDWRRAIAVARRDGAFASAVLQLEKRWPDAARRLREAWGEALAQKGEWLSAIEAVWPIKSARERAIEWMRAAEAAGGELGARALVLRAQLMPDTLSEHAELLSALRDDMSRAGERAALAQALLSIEQLTPASRGLAAVVCPTLLADQTLGRGRFSKRELQQLVTRTGDTLLQADLPPSAWPASEPTPLSQRTEPLVLEAPLPGTQALFDVVPLEDGCWLAALGEAGAAVVSPTGRVGVRFAVPAERLVIGHSGQIALALARRDTLWRVSRIDLAQRRSEDLGLIDAHHFVDTFDGIGWTVACGDRLQVLDTGRSLQDVLWQVTDLPGPVCALSSSARHEHLVVQSGPSTLEVWRYHLPLRRLGLREPLLPAMAQPSSLRALHPDRGLVIAQVEESKGNSSTLSWMTGEGTQCLTGRLALSGEETQGLRLVAQGDFLLVESATVRTLRLVHLHSGQVVAIARWPDGHVQVRSVGKHWLCFDDCGRILVIDIETSSVRAITVR